MSAIAQHGGVSAAAAYRALCGPGSPFTAVTQGQFAALLRGLGAHDVLVQSDDGTLLLGQAGERTVGHYSFYAAFSTPEEYRLLLGGRPLGTVPNDRPLYPDALVIFGGRRWKVTAVDHVHKVIEVTPAAGGRPPEFNGGRGAVHDVVRARMRTVLAAASVPRYLSPAAAGLLSEARAAYTRLGLAGRMAVRDGSDTVLLPWAGSRATHTLAAQLSAAGLEASGDGLVITVLSSEPGQVRELLQELAAAGPADPVALALRVANKQAAKYDDWIEEALLSADYARRALDCPGAWRQASAILKAWPAGL
jgi:ATP-dependent Lhr-like helicase